MWGFCSAPAAAQSTPGPRPGDPVETVPEKIEPSPPTTSETQPAPPSLTEELSRTDGVLRPPTGIDPGIQKPAPVPYPNTTPVIPPPGTPGNNPSLDPK